ncbi:protein kinase domain-containing protein [Enhydrobacter aerosaccus]|nr:peptidoglycan-binding protein [Enhydrobacter aerosaccus]
MRQSPSATDFGALLPGQAVGRFTIEALLGLGAFGATYRARDMRLGCEVTIREFLPPALATRREDGAIITDASRLSEEFARGRRHFLNGGRILAALRAPCIVRVLECLETNGTAYIVTERLAGTTLATRLETQGVLVPADIDHLLWPLLEGLELVHSRGFFHGDINPRNIVLDAEGRPTLIDFGAAGSITNPADASAFTAPEQIGTGATVPAHMTPGKQGPWTDIYGLAATFYYTLTGAPPPKARERLFEDHYQPLMRLRPAGFRPSMLAGIDRGLGLHLRDRPQSIAQWRSILWQTTRVVPAAPAEPPPMLPPRLPPRPQTTETATWQTRRFASPAAPPAPEPPPIVVEKIPPHPVASPASDAAASPAPERAATAATEPGPSPRRSRGLLATVAVASVLAAGAFAYIVFGMPSSPITHATVAPAKTESADQAQAAQEARRKAEAEAAARREEEARQKQVEAEQAALRQQKEEEARRQAEADARRQAELADPKLAQANESALKLTQTDRQQLQAALAAQGFDPQGIDGVFGPRTRQAIAAWQKNRNEPSTGFLSDAQKQALLTSAPSTNTAATPAATTAPAAAPTAAANPFDGTYAGTAELPTGTQPVSLRLVDGKGSAQWKTESCGAADVTLSVSPDGAAALDFKGFTPQCQPMSRHFDGRIQSNTVQFTLPGDNGPSGGLTLTRQE